MPREHMDPVMGEIQTPFGMISYAITQDDHVYLSAGGGGQADLPPLTVNRVEYYTTLHLYRQSETTWTEKDFHDLHMRKPGILGADASFAARKKASEGIRAAWEAFISGKDELLAMAERSNLNNELLRLEEEIEKVRGNLAQLEGKRSDLESQEAAVRDALRELVKRGGWPAPKDWSPRGRVPGEG